MRKCFVTVKGYFFFLTPYPTEQPGFYSSFNINLIFTLINYQTKITSDQNATYVFSSRSVVFFS